MNRYVGYMGYLVFGVALAATLASLFFSEILGWAPCLLCWYQRILLYPIVVISGVGVIRKTNEWPITTLILAGIGWVMALYHSLLQWSIIPESIAPCTLGVSCVTPELDIFGFITIPFMSLVAFSVIISASVLYMKKEEKEIE